MPANIRHSHPQGCSTSTLPTEPSPQVPTWSSSLSQSFTGNAPQSTVNNLCLSHIETAIPKQAAKLQRGPLALPCHTATLAAGQEEALQKCCDHKPPRGSTAGANSRRVEGRAGGGTGMETKEGQPCLRRPSRWQYWRPPQWWPRQSAAANSKPANSGNKSQKSIFHLQPLVFSVRVHNGLLSSVAPAAILPVLIIISALSQNQQPQHSCDLDCLHPRHTNGQSVSSPPYS